MKKILLWNWSSEDCQRAIAALDPNIEVVDWISDIPHLEKSYTRLLYNAGVWNSFTLPHIDSTLTDRELVKFLHMFSREGRSKGINFHEQSNIAKNYFRYFIWLLDSKHVDHVLFSSIPLIGFDYLCYLAANRLKIKTTMCYQSLFPDRFFYCHTLEDFGLFSESTSQTIATPTPSISWGYKKDLFYMKNNFRKISKKNPWVTWFRQTIRFGIRQSKKPMKYSGVIENYIQSIDHAKQYKSTTKSKSLPDVDCKYVYFPLHLQPELSTTGLGGDYSDQIDAIEKVSALIPSDWKVYVKENPKQNFEQRGIEFYRRLRSIANVYYVGKSVDTYFLMKNCQFVATITGTAGWESITGGKACLVFGLAWYLSIPGVVRYNSSVSIDELINCDINQESQKIAFDHLYKKTCEGILDPGYSKIYPNYDETRNANKIANFINSQVL